MPKPAEVIARSREAYARLATYDDSIVGYTVSPKPQRIISKATIHWKRASIAELVQRDFVYGYTAQVAIGRGKKSGLTQNPEVWKISGRPPYKTKVEIQEEIISYWPYAVAELLATGKSFSSKITGTL